MAEEQPFVDSTELSPWDGQTPLPYELSSLTWDADHYKNSQNCYCYCGKSKTQWTSMYKCSGCKQLFHIECLHAKPHHPTLPGDSSYEFKCGLCNNNNGNEHFLQTTKGWLDIVRVALYNLVQNEKRKGSAKRFFQHREELCRFMEKNWANLCADKTRTKTWENTVMSTMSTRLQYFQSGAEIFHAAGYWGPTSESDPSTFVINGTKTQKTESGGNTKKSKTPTNNLVADKKRKAELLGVEDQKVKTAPIKKQKAQTTVFIPRAKFDPVKWGYKRLCIATEHSSDSMKIGPDQMTVSHDLGYRMARASFGVTSGNWYFEVEALPHNGNVRVGWSTEKGDVQAPVGYDRHSYSYRDKEGTKFHQSRGQSYGATWGPGDFIGVTITIPNKAKTDTTKSDDESERFQGSEIAFYKNGEAQGVAYSNIYEGTYYPAVACYKGGNVRFNFGPDFKYPPPATHQPMSELPIDLKENGGDASKDNDVKDVAIEGNGKEETREDNKDEAESALDVVASNSDAVTPASTGDATSAPVHDVTSAPTSVEAVKDVVKYEKEGENTMEASKDGVKEMEIDAKEKV